MHSSDKQPVNEGFVFTRRLRLAGMTGAQDLERRLTALPGLLQAKLDARGRLRLRYDASQVQIDRVIEQIEQQGGALAKGFGAGLRLRWYRFVDANAAQNAGRTDVHCCNKPPKGY